MTHYSATTHSDDVIIQLHVDVSSADVSIDEASSLIAQAVGKVAHQMMESGHPASGPE